MQTQAMFRVAIAGSLLWSSAACAQSEEQLTLDTAVALALQHNRQLRSSRIDEMKVGDRLAAARTQRLPQFSWYTLAAQRLTEVNFRFDQGVFGTYPGIGPIPGTDTEIRTPLKPSLLMIGQVTQPLSQLYKISLGIKQLQVEQEFATEAERAKKSEIVNQIKQSYYAIVQAQSALDAVEESIRLYRETDRITEQYVIQQVALKSDSLDIKARLAKAEYDALAIRNPLETQKEQLNLLLGRDLRTLFRVAPTEVARLTEAQLPELQKIAIERRPEMKQASLRAKQAEYDRRILKSDYIPTVSLSVNYFSPVNYGSLIPSNIAAAGVLFQWEPFDWGRKKHQISEKERVIEQAGLEQRQTEDQIILEVNTRFRKLQEAKQLLAVAGLSRELAQEKLRVTTNRYKQEVVLIKDVLQQQATLAEANHQYSQTLAAFWIANADLEKALGEPR
jgi:outer membrane protein TolC